MVAADGTIETPPISSNPQATRRKMTNQAPTSHDADRQPFSRLRAWTARSLVAATLTCGGIAGLATVAQTAHAATAPTTSTTTTSSSTSECDIVDIVCLGGSDSLAQQMMANQISDAQEQDLINTQLAADTAKQTAEQQAINEDAATSIFETEQNTAMNKAALAARSSAAMDQYVGG